MHDYWDDDDEIYNEFSGSAENVVQSGRVHGDVDFNDIDINHHHYYDDRDGYGSFEYTIVRGAGIIFFLALFLVSSDYSHIFNTVEFGLWDWGWIKITISTLFLGGAFITSENWIFDNPSFGFLRVAFSILVMILGYNYGSNFQIIQDFNTLTSYWLIWKF